ncbi:MAG: ABC transporter permease [Alphaproteobacteria bacterium]
MWNKMLSLIINAVSIGLIFGLVSVGVFISFRILDFPDLTVDSSFVLGGAVSATLIMGFGLSGWLTIPFAFAAGCLAGLTTAWLHLRFNILHLLASILTMLALFSVNIFLMGLGQGMAAYRKALASGADNASSALIEQVKTGRAQLYISDTITRDFDFLKAPIKNSFLGDFLRTKDVIDPLISLPVVIIIIGLIIIFLRSEYGLALRAVGANKRMAQANGINTKSKIYVGMALSNGLVALGGLFYSHLFHSSADTSLSIGIIVYGLAGVIIGETILPFKSIAGRVFAVVIGSITYRIAIMIALNNTILPMPTYFIRIASASIVAIALIIPFLHKEHKARQIAKSFKDKFQEKEEAAI